MGYLINNAFYVATHLSSKVQRQTNQYEGEPLMVILPGAALSGLWGMMALLENSLRLVSLLVLVAAPYSVSHPCCLLQCASVNMKYSYCV